MKEIKLNNNKVITSQRFASWFKMTNENEHNRVRVAMANFFDDIESGKNLINLCITLDQKKSINHADHILRHKLTNKFLSDVRKVYGDNVVINLYNCL